MWIFGVLPMAIDKTAVILVQPTKDSRFDLRPEPAELKLIKEELAKFEKEASAKAKAGTKGGTKGGTADKNANLILGLL